MMTFVKKPSHHLSFLNTFTNSPILLLCLIYCSSLLIAAIITPLIFNATVAWNLRAPNTLNTYLLHKGFVVFFDRIRFISLLFFIPILWKIYRRYTPNNGFNTLSIKNFCLFLTIGCLLITTIFGVKSIILGCSWKTLPNAHQTIGLIFCSSLIISFLEEWLFRGIIFKVFFNKTSSFFAILFASLIFAYFHFNPRFSISTGDGFVTIFDGIHCLLKFVFSSLEGISWPKFWMIFSLGYLLTLVYYYTEILGSSIGLHFGIIFTLMILKKHVSFPTKNSFLGSNDLFNSPLALCFIWVMIVFIYLYYIHRNKKKTAYFDECASS